MKNSKLKKVILIQSVISVCVLLLLSYITKIMFEAKIFGEFDKNVTTSWILGSSLIGSFILSSISCCGIKLVYYFNRMRLEDSATIFFSMVSFTILIPYTYTLIDSNLIYSKSIETFRESYNVGICIMLFVILSMNLLNYLSTLNKFETIEKKIKERNNQTSEEALKFLRFDSEYIKHQNSYKN